MKRPTQKDVARKAGVSRSTVSYVLNDRNDMKVPISPETRQRVWDAIAELGYEPDARAQSLRRGNTQTVGVIIPVIQNPFFWQILSGITDELAPAGYSVYLSMHTEETDRALQELVQQRVDGFILLVSVKHLSAELTAYLRKSGRPAVEITASAAEFDQVVHSYDSGTQDLMTYLFELGHERIGFIYGVTKETQGADRLLVYRKALQTAGLSDTDLADPAPYEVHCGVTMDEAYAAAYTLLDRPDRPTALLVINDMLAIAVMRAAGDLGLSIPGDLSIAGFDDIPFASYTLPRLTTVSGKAEESGRDAVHLLLQRFEEPDLPQQVTTTEVELIIRESTGPVP